MDPIAEMFAQIRNARNSAKESLQVPFSKVKMAILKILKANGKIVDFYEIKDDLKRIEIKINESQIWQAERISKPGRRVYASNGKIPKAKTYHGLVIVSTPEGVMAGEEARQKGLGGEVIVAIF